MYRATTHHGFKFGVDVADWTFGSDDDAEAAADNLIRWLESLDGDTPAQLHADLIAERDTGADMSALSTRAVEAGDKARAEAMADWASRPSNGHNCGLYAA